MATWMTGSARWIKKFCVQNSKGETTITIVDRKNKNNRSKIHQWTVDRKIGGKGNWMNLQLMYPNLKLGLQDIDENFKKNCPFCNFDVPETVDHILL
ncbi:hypothetical protein AYI68_g4508, partial [Smittium mucronatum]